MRQLICKKTKACKYADEFVIYDTGKIKDRRVKPLVYKQLKKKQLMELRKMLRDNAEYLEKNICNANDEFIPGALYINAYSFMGSGAGKTTTARVINWNHEKEIYAFLDHPDNKIFPPDYNPKNRKEYLSRTKGE